MMRAALLWLDARPYHACAVASVPETHATALSEALRAELVRVGRFGLTLTSRGSRVLGTWECLDQL